MVRRSRYGGVRKVTLTCTADHVGTVLPGVGSIREFAAPLQCLEKRGGGVYLPCGEQKPGSVCGEYRRRIYWLSMIPPTVVLSMGPTPAPTFRHNPRL
jgi:hypothetical protein